MADAYIVRRTPGGVDRTDEFLAGPMVAIGWSMLGELTDDDKEDIREKFKQQYPDDGPRATGLRVGYIDRLVNRMDIGDTVLVPKRGDVYVGTVDDEYDYKESIDGDYKHQRPVDWKFNASPIDGQKAPQAIHKKLYPGTVSHTVQDIDDNEAVETFLNQSAGADMVRYYDLLRDGRLYGINKKTIEEAMLTVFQQYYPTMQKSGTRADEDGDTDLIARDLPGNVTVRIQVKHYDGDSMGPDPVNQLTKSMGEGDIGIVATVGDVATSAETKAIESDYDISVIDGWDFTELVFEHRAEFSRDELQLLGLDALPGTPQ